MKASFNLLFMQWAFRNDYCVDCDVRLFLALLLDLEIDLARGSSVIFCRIGLLYSIRLGIVFLKCDLTR